ncbi:unnamed protein product, partial [Ixodes pacificus]
PPPDAGTLRKPGGSFQVVVGSSSSAGTRKGKKYSCERIRQLESEVWLAERELLLLKEKVSARHCTPPLTLRRTAEGAASHPKPPYIRPWSHHTKDRLQTLSEE